MTLKTFINNFIFDYEKIELLDFYKGSVLFEGENSKLKRLLRNNSIPNYQIVNIRSCINKDYTDDEESEVSGFVIQVRLNKKGE